MPRNGSGTATRVTPPGASGYIAGNDILPSEVNGEINDIYNELTNSIDKAGRTTPTANLPMGGFLHSGLGQATANGQTLRYQVLTKGTDINITASGSQSIPSEGSTFVVTAASAFNITGFTNRYDGRTATLVLPANITLVHSASLLLKNGVSRVSVAGEAITVFQQSTGVWKEIGDQNLIDLSSYSGADITLGINQVAKYDVSSATSLLLRIATNEGSYKLELNRDSISVGATVAAAVLRVNNAVLGSNAINRQWTIGNNNAAPTSANANENVFTLAGGGTLQSSSMTLVTRTLGKKMYGIAKSIDASTNYSVSGSSDWLGDTTTAWTSLGTIIWPAAWSGLVTVTRLY